MSEYDYKNDLIIDRYYLDDIVDNHAVLFQKYAELHAIALEDRNQTKEKGEVEKARTKDDLERVKARLILNIKLNFKDYSFDKLPTEATCDAWVTSHQDYQAALTAFRTAQHEWAEKLNATENSVELLKIARDSFDQRKYMIEAQVRLFVSGFWSRPLQPRQNTEERKQELQKVNETVGNITNESVQNRRRKL